MRNRNWFVHKEITDLSDGFDVINSLFYSGFCFCVAVSPQYYILKSLRNYFNLTDKIISSYQVQHDVFNVYTLFSDKKPANKHMYYTMQTL